MHQTDGATLHCLRADTGLPLWQLPVPGTLVHLEGSPTVEKGRVYLGGGAAGVLCVDMNRVSLDGKEMDLAAIQKVLDVKWAALQKKYEEDVKKDPDFAVKPTEAQLPKPSPRKVWEQGKDKWHVDAPVAVAGDLVLAASAFLDNEKVGDRALLALDAATGAVKWRTPLALNPWGGPTVSGDTIIVGGSNIYPEDIERAVGTIEGVRAGNVIAFGVLDRNKEAVVVVAEVRDTDLAAVRRAVHHRVLEAVGIPPKDVVLLGPGSVPKTSSGKLQRSLCRQRYDDGSLIDLASG